MKILFIINNYNNYDIVTNLKSSIIFSVKHGRSNLSFSLKPSILILTKVRWLLCLKDLLNVSTNSKTCYGY